MTIVDPKIDRIIQNSHPTPAIMPAIMAMTPEMYIAAQVLSGLAQGVLRSEEAWTDEHLPTELAEKSVQMAKLLIAALGGK